MQTDIMHLADIFETFRDTYVSKGIILTHVTFYTSPGLSWNAMLYSTKIKLNLITDQSILKFFKSLVRRGVITVFHHYAEANNPYLPNFGESKPKSYISSYRCIRIYTDGQCHKSFLLETSDGLLKKKFKKSSTPYPEMFKIIRSTPAQV